VNFILFGFGEEINGELADKDEDALLKRLILKDVTAFIPWLYAVVVEEASMTPTVTDRSRKPSKTPKLTSPIMTYDLRG